MEQTSISKGLANNDHDHRLLSLGKRWLLGVFIVAIMLFFLKPFLIELLLARASSYFSSYYFDETARISRKIVFIDKDNIDAWRLLGKAYKEKAVMDKSTGNYDNEKNDIRRSITAYERAFSLDPKDIRISFEIGMLYFSIEGFSEAVHYFEYGRNTLTDSSGSQQADTLGYRSMSLSRAMVYPH